MKRVLIATAVCLLVAPFVLSITPNQTVQEKIAIRDALRRGGLREAARLKGNYVAEYDPHWDWGKFDLETLTKGSTAVVVGRVTKKLEARLLEGTVIFTEYEVAIDEVIKGNLKQRQSIVVVLPGGRIDFGDGTSAEQTTPTFDHARVGRAYTIFLMVERAVPSVFFLSGGPQGLFDIEDSSSVKSHGRADDPSAVEANGRSRDLFLESIRKHARKWPEPGKCCGW